MHTRAFIEKYFPLFPLIVSLYFVLRGLRFYFELLHYKFQSYTANYTFWNGFLYSQLYGKIIILGLVVYVIAFVVSFFTLGKKPGSMIILLINILFSLYFVNLSSSALGQATMVPLIVMEEQDGQECSDRLLMLYKDYKDCSTSSQTK